MQAKRLIVPLVNVCVFAAAGIALYELGNRHAWTGDNQPIVPASEAVQTEVPVEVGTVQRTTLNRSLTVYGHVEPAPASATQPAGAADVSVPSVSLVAEVNCVEGEQVDKGQVLFSLDNRAALAAIGRAQQRVDALDKLAGSKPSDTPVWLNLFDQWQRMVAELELQQAQTDESLLHVVSPISGTVAVLRARPGEIVDPKIPAVEIVDASRLVVALDVPGFYVGDLKIGQNASIDVGNHVVQSDVRFIDPTIDAATGVASVDISVAQNSGLTPGQFVRARIILEQRADCLAVPADSIVQDSLGRSQIAIVSDDQKTASMRIIETGIRDADMVQIIADGLQGGETIVTNGAYGLATRTGIRVVGN
jgi:membrane fusion protein, multidrug efflux system